jgi:hypothetical protein
LYLIQGFSVKRKRLKLGTISCQNDQNLCAKDFSDPEATISYEEHKES